MTILFICTGDRFRSMLAEAEAKKQGISAISAGTDASPHVYDSVRKLVRKNNLEEFVEYNPEQVTQEKIDQADKIICMENEHKKYLEDNFDVKNKPIEVWGVPDADPEDDLQPIFEKIKSKIKKIN